MTPERAWELAPRLIARGLVPDASDFNQLRTVVALALLNCDEPEEVSDINDVLRAKPSRGSA